jgi:uncharacterized protein YhfF
MSEPSKIEEYWQAFLKTQPDPAATAQRFYESFYFSSSEAVANELAGLVRQGIKTATSALVWENEAEGKRTVQPGDLSIVTDWNKNPVCVIETTEVELKPFKEVDEQFAYDYGEGERTLAWWKEALWDSYAPICAALSQAPSEDMVLICERFRVVFE